MQNLPLGIGFFIGYEQFRSNNLLSGLLWIIFGTLIGIIFIRYTETLKISTQRESWNVTLTNFIVFVIFMIVLIEYLIASWSGWLTDIIFGVLAGIILSISQSLAAKEKISLNHSLAFGIVGPLALIGIRFLTESLSIVLVLIIVVFIVTLLISAIDY